MRFGWKMVGGGKLGRVEGERGLGAEEGWRWSLLGEMVG